MLHIRSMKCKYPCSVVLITPTHSKWNIFKSLKLNLHLERGYEISSIWTLCCSGVCFHIVCKRLWHWIWRQYISWKQWYLSNKLCGTTSQKANTAIFTNNNNNHALMQILLTVHYDGHIMVMIIRASTRVKN